MSHLLRFRVADLLRCLALFSACLGLAMGGGCQRAESPADKPPVVTPETLEKPGAEELDEFDESKATTGREAFNRMIIAYRKAMSYADAGTVRLQVESGGQKIIDETADFSLALERPNKIRLHAHRALLVCDGKKLYAAIEDQPGQVLVKPAPIRVTVKTLQADRMLAMAMTQGIGGAMPQVVLLLADDPIKALLPDDDQPELIEPGEIDGRECYRVRVQRPDGEATFWVDKENFILRRVVLPTDEIREAIGRQQPVDRISLVAELSGARIDGKIDPKAFEFESPEGAEIVKFFVPPNVAQLLGKKVPGFKFHDLDGEPVAPESLAGKIAVLDFWATWCGPCRQSLPELQKVYQQFKDNPKVAFYAVSVDQPKMDNSEVAKVLAELKVEVPILRDAEQSAAVLKFSGIPTMFIIGPDGVVQDCQQGGNPKLAEELPPKLEKLLAGENIYEKPLKEYQDRIKQYAKLLEESSKNGQAAEAAAVEERSLPEVKTAPRSEPATMKLAPLWKCNDVKSPGNILVLREKEGPVRLAVVENWKSVAEVGLDGKLVAVHGLDLADTEVVGCLRTAEGADGKRRLVAFLTTQQRCHVLDENWKPMFSYPEDAMKNPHSGIADVELGDLDGDGNLEMCVSYWGVVGVQAVSLEAKRLWVNRSVSNVIGMAVGSPDDKGRRNLYCTNNTGSLVVLDAEGQRKEEIQVDDRMLHWIVAADLRGDGKPLWCGMAAPKLGENLAIGLSLSGKELWNYALPPGVQPQPVEPIVAGQITRELPGQWILPGPDGSVHFVSADGKPLDKFNSGVTLQGLAAVEIDGQPALVISSADGLEAWKVERGNAN